MADSPDPSRTTRQSFLHAVRHFHPVRCWLPRAEAPVDPLEAAAWLEESRQSGFEVDFRVEPDEEGAAEVWLRRWSSDDVSLPPARERHEQESD